MIERKKVFYGGCGLFLGFIVVLVILFLPIFGQGKNGLDYMDSLYNTISKGSAYYIPGLREDAKEFAGKAIAVEIEMSGEKQAKATALLFEKSGAAATASGSLLRVEGDLGNILANCLDDSDAMFKNRGEAINTKYGYPEKRVLYNWWTALKLTDKALKKQKLFPEAAFIDAVKKKAVECSYNFYKIEPQDITDQIGLVLFSLVFYVVYTMWYGFAIMFMFEGWGLKLEH